MIEKENITLSEREQQVLQMVATGASNQQIAQELVISINTVKVHMRNIFEKLGVQSRTEASMLAIQNGLITVTENGTEAGGPAKTFLLQTTSPTTLAGWQHIYLTVAMLVALGVLFTPIFYRLSNTPYIPLLMTHSSEETPPPSEQTDTSAVENSKWTIRNPMTVGRAGLAVVAYEGNIYAIGGIKTNNKATRFVEIYDPERNEWSDGTTKPTATTDIAGAAIADKLFVPGGCTSDNEALDILEIYDPQHDTWATGASLPAARCGYGLAQLDDKLYLFGGWDGQTFTDTVFVYEYQADAWRILDTTLPESNGYMGVITVGHDIYVMGGYNGQEMLASTYQFTPATNQWSKKASMRENRAGFGLVAMRDTIYILGGGWSKPVTAGEKYNLADEVWASFDTPALNQWRNLGSVVVETQIFAIGGRDEATEEMLDTTFSHNVLYELFIPVSLGN